MKASHLICSVLFFLISFVSSAQSTFIYSYNDPCTGVLKSIDVPTNGVTVTYYGQVQTFNQDDFVNGNFETWATNLYNSYGGNNPCGSILGVNSVIDIAGSTAISSLYIFNSIDAATQMQQGGFINSLGAVESVKKASEKKDKKNKNNSSTRTNGTGTNVSTESTGTNGTGTNGTGTNGTTNVSTESTGTGNGTGTNGSTNGSTGTNGTTGTNGSTGTNGTTGTGNGTGTNGSTNGSTGANGTTGTNATNGTNNGTNSTNGAVGTNGTANGESNSSGLTNNNQNQTNGTSNSNEGSTTNSGSNETNTNGGNGTTNQNAGTENSTQTGGTTTQNGSNENGSTSTGSTVTNSTGTNETTSGETTGTTGSNETTSGETTGTTGSNGTTGNNGTNGSTGTNGTTGNNGTNGSTGTNGTTGNNGTNGTTGNNGTNGSNNEAGSNETTGNNGTTVTNETGSNGSTNETTGNNGTTVTNETGSNGSTNGSNGNNISIPNNTTTPDNSSSADVAKDDKKTTDILGGSVTSIQKSTENGKPQVILSSDFTGFNFKNNDVVFGGKGTAGYTSLRWDGKRTHGVLLDYTSVIKGPNLTAFYANITKRRIDLISTTGTLSFAGKGSLYGTLAIGQMWSFPKVKSLKVIYMATSSFGQVYRQKFLGTAFITGGMYDWKASKRFDVKFTGLFIYAPYVSYYNDIVLKSPYVVMPIIGTNIAITKKFKLNVNMGGTYAINENIMNFTVMFGTRLAL